MPLGGSAFDLDVGYRDPSIRGQAIEQSGVSASRSVSVSASASASVSVSVSASASASARVSGRSPSIDSPEYE